MKNLQRLLFAAAFLSVMPSTVVLGSEESIVVPAKNTEKSPIHTNRLIALATGVAGSYGFVAGASAVNASKQVKKTLLKACEHKAYSLAEGAISEHLTRNIKKNKVVMGISCLAMVGPTIVSTVVDKFNAINKQNKENDKVV